MNVTVVPLWEYSHCVTTVGYSCDSSQCTLGSEPASSQPQAKERKCWHLRGRWGRKYWHQTKLCVSKKRKWRTTMVEEEKGRWVVSPAATFSRQGVWDVYFSSRTSWRSEPTISLELIWLTVVQVLIIYIIVDVTRWWNNQSRREGGMLLGCRESNNDGG